MSVASGPPQLPPDSPGSSVSSRLQNEYNDLLRRAVVISHSGVTTKVTMNPTTLGLGQPATNNKSVPEADLIDLSGPDTHRTDVTQSDIDTQREQLSQIPSLQQLLHTAAVSAIGLQNADNRLTASDYDDPMVHHILRYSELMTNDLESKPINEKMDHWYLDLKKNLMTEFDKLRLQFLEEAQEHTLREKQAQAKEYIRLNQDIKTMREMLTHYEHTIEQKDQTEKNLTKALDLLYDKTIAYRRYYEWRIVHIERRRQEYSFTLARRFYEDKMKRKALISWKSVVEREWKKRFEAACEKKAKDVLIELGNEYELKYKQLELQLLNAHEEIARLKTDKGEHDDDLKQAFMRGVCALNMEAMSVLLKNDKELETTASTSDDPQHRRYCNHHTSSDEPFINEEPPSASNEETGLRSSSQRHPHSFPTHVFKEYLPSTIYRTGEARSIRPSTSSHQPRHVTFQKRQSNSATNRSRYPMNNVLVERHAPTNHIRS